jgi:hypothetical protein
MSVNSKSTDKLEVLERIIGDLNTVLVNNNSLDKIESMSITWDKLSLDHTTLAAPNLNIKFKSEKVKGEVC